MKKLDNFSEANQKVLKDILGCIINIRNVTEDRAETIDDGIAILRNIRSEVYEDLNQIQHEAMILRAARFLGGQYGKKIKWEWNPRQTGTGDEPDLRGSHKGRIILSAEVTTSEEPVGKIDGRMRETLAKLAVMEGDKYYFVGMASMAKRAQTKVQKNGYKIKIIKI